MQGQTLKSRLYVAISVISLGACLQVAYADAPTLLVPTTAYDSIPIGEGVFAGEAYNALTGETIPGKSCVKLVEGPQESNKPLPATAASAIAQAPSATPDQLTGSGEGVTGSTRELAGVVQDWVVDMADSEEELASLSGLQFGARAGAYKIGGSLEHSTHSFTKQTFLVARNTIDLPPAEQKFEPNVPADILNDPVEFYKKCGTHYVSGIHRRAEFYALFKSTYIGEQERTSLAAFLKAKWVGGSVDVSAFQQQISNRTRLSIQSDGHAHGVANRDLGTNADFILDQWKHFGQAVANADQAHWAHSGDPGYPSPFIAVSGTAIPYYRLVGFDADYREQYRVVFNLFVEAQNVSDYLNNLNALLKATLRQDTDSVLGWAQEIPAELGSVSAVNVQALKDEIKKATSARDKIRALIYDCQTTPASCDDKAVAAGKFEPKEIRFVDWRVLNLDGDGVTDFGEIKAGQSAEIRSEGGIRAVGGAVGGAWKPILTRDAFFVHVRKPGTPDINCPGDSRAWGCQLSAQPMPINAKGSLSLSLHPDLLTASRVQGDQTAIAGVLIH